MDGMTRLREFAATLEPELRDIAGQIEGEARPAGDVSASAHDLLPEWEREILGGWPRFEDGELVKFGSKYVDDDGGIRTVTHIELTCGGIAMLRCYGLNELKLSRGERVKRPAPKVLDADGVEIREKRDVWWICEGDELGVHAERLRVETICLDGFIECSPYNGGTWVYLEPSELYVNKPVLAADGKPLREGETVYEVGGDGTAYVFDGMADNVEGLAMLHHDGKPYIGTGLHVDQLTHERPFVDTWERLEEDCAKFCIEYCDEHGLLDSGCNATEGDASTRHCTDCGDSCEERMARDLVRRARELAERGER